MDRGVAAERRWPLMVALIATAVVVVLLALSGQYGFHRDELYFIVAGQHQALGYPDQPPFAPLVSAAAVELLGLSPTAIRVLPALCAGAVVVLAALIARALGGSPRAEALAALVTGVSGLLAAGHLDSTATYDVLAWTAILWLTVRLLAGADPRGWLLVGIVAGIGLENKHILLFLGLGLVIGIVIARRWDVIRSPWPWLGAAVALVLWAPNLVWQAQNGFPQLEMASRISGSAGENRADFVPELLLISGAFVFPVVLAGAWRLLRSPATRPWRPLGWAALVVPLLVLVTGGKSYYAAGLLALLAGSGAIPLDGWLDRGTRLVRDCAFATAVIATAAVSAILTLPIVPVATLGSTPIPDIYKESAEQVGWPELVATVTDVVDRLPPGDRSRAVIMTSNYGEASSLALLGDELPPVVSGHNAYWDWGPPPDDRTVVVLVGPWPAEHWAGTFGQCQVAATIDNGLGVQNEEQGTAVRVCPAMAATWSVSWPDLRHLD